MAAESYQWIALHNEDISSLSGSSNGSYDGSGRSSGGPSGPRDSATVHTVSICGFPGHGTLVTKIGVRLTCEAYHLFMDIEGEVEKLLLLEYFSKLQVLLIVPNCLDVVII